MSRRKTLVAASILLALLVGGAGLAFKRTTVEGTNVCLWWGTRNLTYEVNDFTNQPARYTCSNSTTTTSNAAAVRTAIDLSFDAWAQAGATTSGRCTDLSFAAISTGSVDTGDDRRNAIVARRGPCSLVVPRTEPCWRDYSCGDLYNCWMDLPIDPKNNLHQPQVIALTTVTYDTGTGQIWDADIELNSWDPQYSGYGQYLTCVEPGTGVLPCQLEGNANCIDMDVQNAITHEAGHFLGLAHPCQNIDDCALHPEISRKVTMYPSVNHGQTFMRDLEQDDIDGICTIYPAAQKTANCIDGPCPPPCAVPSARSGGGCNQGAGGLLSLLGVAAVALSCRRGRRTE